MNVIDKPNQRNTFNIISKIGRQSNTPSSMPISSY